MIKNSLLSTSISHLRLVTKQTEKVNVLKKLLERGHVCIVYVSSLLQAQHLYNTLHQGESNGNKLAIFNEKLQNTQQNQIIQDFKEGKLSMIISSANQTFERGLDLPLISLVVNVDLPTTTEDYINRCGRTSRVQNKKGCSLTLLINGEEKYLDRLTHSLKLSATSVTMNEVFDYLK